MLTITRRQALQLRGVLRRVFGTGTRGLRPALGFIAEQEGLTVRSMSATAAVEYRIPGPGTAHTLWLPCQFLDDCAARNEEPVRVETTGKGQLTAHWRDGNVPQILQYDEAPAWDTAQFPRPPEALAENPPALLDALIAAADTCDPQSVRYSLGHLQLRGDQGAVVATDGRQLLVQAGFTFPWSEALLIPQCKAFCSCELPRDVGSLIEIAQQLRSALRDLQYRATSLVKALKHQRRQKQAVEHTIAQLRQLKTLGI